MLKDYQKKLIAEGFYSRLKEESTPDKKIEMILEFMESFIPSGTIPSLQEGVRFGFGQPLDNAPVRLYQDTISPPAFTATKKDC